MESRIVTNPECEETENSCMTCMQRKFSLLSELNQKELSILNARRYSVKYKKGESIFKEGMKPFGLICLSKGKVKVGINTVSGNEHIISLKKPVNFIGFNEFLTNGYFVNSALVLEDTEICIIDREDFLKVLINNHEFSFKLLVYHANEMIANEKRLVNLTQKHMIARIADALLLIHKIYGTNPENDALDADFKRRELASLSNMSVENVSRTLSKLEESKAILVNKRKIIITDLKKLENISVVGS